MRKWFFPVVTMLLLWSYSYCSAESLKINTSIKPPFSTEQGSGFFDLLIAELSARVGVHIELARLPAERALQMVNDGLSDGDLPRISGLSSTYPDLIEVKEPVIDYHFVAFKHKEYKSKSVCWEKLKDKNVGFIIGWKIYEKKVSTSASVTRVSSPAQLFKVLNSRRIDVALYERYAGRYQIQSQNYLELEECKYVLAVRPMHIYLNKKHEKLADVFSEELKEMKNDGSWDKIALRTLKRSS